MLDTPGFLREERKKNSQPPFSNAQIDRRTIQREIMYIYWHATPETKPFYDIGRNTDGIEGENWVIRWLLWHVFRYRDNRNRSRKQGTSSRCSLDNCEPSDGGDSATAYNGELDLLFGLFDRVSDRTYRKDW